MKKWIVWLKKSSPWIFLLIGPVLNFYLLEWYTHNPFQTMKPYIQGMNLALFEFAALFLFALTGRISRALGIETAFCAVYGLANYFVLNFAARPSSRGHSFDLDRCQRRGQLRIQIEPHRSNRADLFCPASGSGIFPEKRLSEKK
ncbi:MAG: hypothetical protein ACLURV_13090 [Gallintestinimicrobium sp.]